MPRSLKAIKDVLTQNSNSNSFNSLQAIRSQIFQKYRHSVPNTVSTFINNDTAENLLTPIPKVESMSASNHSVIKKIFKTYFKLIQSSEETKKVALASNEIGRTHNCFVYHQSLIEENLRNEEKHSAQILLSLENKFSDSASQYIKSATRNDTSFIFKSAESLQNAWYQSDASGTDSNEEGLMVSQQAEKSYRLVLNPMILYGSDPYEDPEECICLPLLKFSRVPRYRNLLVHYWDEDLIPHFKWTTGFISRVFQHQIQHLNGKVLLDWRINHGSMERVFDKELQKYFPKTLSKFEQYSQALNHIFKEFPELIQTKSEYIASAQTLQKTIEEDRLHRQDSSKGSSTEYGAFKNRAKRKRNLESIIEMSSSAQKIEKNQQFSINAHDYLQQLPFQDDYILSITKHYSKEMIKFDKQIELGLISESHLKKSQEQTKSVKAHSQEVNNTEKSSVKVGQINVVKKQRNYQQDEIPDPKKSEKPKQKSGKRGSRKHKNNRND